MRRVFKSCFLTAFTLLIFSFFVALGSVDCGTEYPCEINEWDNLRVGDDGGDVDFSDSFETKDDVTDLKV